MPKSDNQIVEEILNEEISNAVENAIEPFLKSLQGKYAPDIIANALCVGLMGVATAKSNGDHLVAKTYYTDLVLHWRGEFNQKEEKEDENTIKNNKLPSCS